MTKVEGGKFGGGGSKNYLQTPATHQSFYEDIVMKSCYLAIVKTQLLLTGDHFSALGLYVYFGLFGIQTFFFRIFDDWCRGINTLKFMEGLGGELNAQVDPNGD